MSANTSVAKSNYGLINLLFCLIFLLIFNLPLCSQSGIPLDVSGMFNERGFLKSGSISPDEGEMINNFNGNLCYTFPMFNMKGPGDIHLDLSLNYNGSVNYQIVAATKNYVAGNSLPRYNLSAPGWILSLNGMAIQMLNFETNFFTKPTNNAVYNYNVRMLAMGYHLTDNLQNVSSGQNDIITLMRGDGSTVYLKRISNDCISNNFENCYIGDYYVDGLGDYSRARVEFIENASWPAYRNRRVSFMKGDGLTYVYEEYKNQYMDYPYNTQSSYQFKPQVFLLKSICDRFGNKLDLSYNYSVNIDGNSKTVYGRPFISSILGSWLGSSINFNYVFGNNLAINISNNNSTYSVQCDGQPANFDSTGNHRYYPVSLVNPANEHISFEHQTYHRTAINLINPYSGGGPMSVILDNDNGVRRILSVTNYFGGKREYTYIDSSLPDWSIDMGITAPNKIWSGHIGGRYFGQGRDLFFVNMIGSKVTYDASAVKSTTSFNYYYDVNGRSDTLTEPINYNDYYSTKIITSNPSGNIIYDTPNNKGTFFKFRDYKITVTSDSHQEYPDWQGHTKLYETIDFIGDTNSIVKKTQYYDGNTINGGISKGAFLDTAIVEKINNITKSTRFHYGYFNTPFQEDTYKNPIQSILQIDDFGLRTLIYNSFIYDSSAHYLNAFFKANSPLNEQVGDTTDFYVINQPTSKRIFINDRSPLLYYDSTNYLRTNSDTGYMGQILRHRIFDITNYSNFKDINYAYYVRDTVGRFLYPVYNTKPSNEGKLKSLTDARGNPVKYYYHPVYSTEYQTDDLPGRPHITFYLLNADGTIDSSSQTWEDTRMPVITQSYVNEANSLFLFNKYDYSGKLFNTFNDNKYSNQLKYDELERISQVNFPYDFGSPDTTIYVDTIYEDVDMSIKADLISSYDFLNNKTKFYKEYNNVCNVNRTLGDIAYWFHLNVIDSGGPPSDKPIIEAKVLPLIRFTNREFFRSLISIKNAYFELYPKYFSRYTGNDTSLSNVKLLIQPLKEMYIADSSIIFTEATLEQFYYSNAYMIGPVDCTSYFENDFDVTNLLNTHIFTNHDSVVAFKIDAKPVYSTEYPPFQNYYMDFYPESVSCSFNTWCPIASPVLHVVGVKKTIKRDTILTYQNFSTKFDYDKDEKSVLTNIKYSNTSVGKRKSLFDGFYRVKQNRLYTSINDFDSTAIQYNYLNLKLNSKDGRENLTKYSYNQYLNPSKTENPDASYTLLSESYYNGYTNSFGSITGMIVKKVLTDEMGNNFEKYYDALGNLRTEIKYIEGNPSENPLEQVIPLSTDYKYDTLYRVIEVKTPNDNHIYYTYDGLGRQSSRTTPDAGLVKYKYDKNDNLRFSQDNNQANKPSERTPARYISYRGYDGLNRLLYLCDAYNESELVLWSSLNPDNTYDFESYTNTPNNFLVINVYDTLTNFPANASTLFTGNHVPDDYYTSSPHYTNNTKGYLCATSYRTIGTDEWSYKYYRYDARGRVIKMWNYIAGLGWKITKYEYNSQNQITKLEYQNESDTDYKRFIYNYDYAGRMYSVSTEESGPPPDYNFVFANYKYNENSQIDSLLLNNSDVTTSYNFNNRNWITNCNTNYGMINYTLDYQANGNISYQYFTGSYRSNFTDIKYVRSNFTYDKSNRLKKIEKFNSKYFDLTGDYSYDPDGNFTSLTRSYNNDNFTYDYYSGTNRLKKVTGSTDQYTYDYNGNMTSDINNYNYNIKYDHRNLIYEMMNTSSPNFTFLFRYKYDEAGNRTRKTIYRSDIQPPPPINENSDNPGSGWIMMKDEYYSRDVSGKEIAVYQSYALDYWNVWGSNNEGRIKSTGMKYFYLKDHLGSIRAVINQNNVLVEAQDYDPWGHIARMWDTTSTNYKFVGKERDIESSYDYFGARYYDSRIGRWGQSEPLLDKYLSYSPYLYGLSNPINLIDANGLDVYISGPDAVNTVKAINESTNNNFFVSIDPKTGKLSCEGKAVTGQEILLQEAIINEKIIVNLITTDGNFIPDNPNKTDKPEPFSVGLYYGSEKNGEITNTYQFFNLDHAKIYEKAGGSNVGLSVIHEILESYIGGILFPKQGVGYNKLNQVRSHNDVVDLELPLFQYYPQTFHLFENKGDNSRKHKVSFIRSEKKKFDFILFRNQEK